MHGYLSKSKDKCGCSWYEQDVRLVKNESMSQEGASGKCSVSSAGGRNSISTASTPYPEETCSKYWLFPVLTSGISEETKEQKETKQKLEKGRERNGPRPEERILHTKGSL